MLDFRLFRPEDTDRCLALIRAGHDPGFTLERFRWLHREAPLSPSCIAVCEDGNDIVGIYSVIRRTVRLGDRTFVGGRDVDPVVHPSHRGRGVFSRLLEFGLNHFQGIDFCYNFANPAAAHGFRRKGWSDAGPLEDRVCQLGFRSLFSKDFVIWCGSGSRVAKTPRAGTREIDRDELDAFLGERPADWSPIAPPARLWVERSPAYLRWRYLDSPLRRYRYFLHEEDGRPRGLAICRFDADPNRLFVLDVLGLDGPADVAPWLPLWRRTFPGAWVGIWSTVPPATRRGFIGNPLNRGAGQPFLVRPFSGRSPELLSRPGGWFVSHGDVEIT